MLLRSILTILALTYGAEALKILVYYPTPSYSHQRGILALTENLVLEGGHQLYVISPNVIPGLEKNENYTFVDISFSYDFISDEKKEGTINLQRQISKWNMLEAVEPQIGMWNKQWSSEAFQQFKRRVDSERIKFDLAILESSFAPFTCPMTKILSENTPIIIMSPISMDPCMENTLGTVKHLSFLPSIFSDYTDKMSLWQRMENWYSDTRIMFGILNKKELAAKKFFKEKYGVNANFVDICYRDISLVMLASNFLYYYPRSIGPNIVEVGPLHLKRPKKLPKNLQDWLDGADKGVIYFSLGSNMKSKSLPEEVRSHFLKFFKALPLGYRVLWKWELDGKIPGQSDNILAQKWLPQGSVLAHRKVSLFVTQGGHQSFQETVHYGVPTIGIPWFGDQELNVAKMVDAEIGVRLRPQELYSYENIKSAFEAVLYDERYSQNMKRLSDVSHDFTAQGMEKSIFWIEHVAKFGGAHLRPSTADTTLFQYFCLDILSVIVVLVLTLSYVVYAICKLLISIVHPKLSMKIKKA